MHQTKLKIKHNYLPAMTFQTENITQTNLGWQIEFFIEQTEKWAQ
jgi:hypothetical protein